MKTIMFHRFIDESNLTTGQGSTHKKKLEKYIQDTGEKNFINEKDIDNFLGNQILPRNKILLTFDDGLTSQFISAKPVLDIYGIKAFWFMYTKTFENNYDENEILNYYISRNYDNFSDFYNEFEALINPAYLDWEVEEFKEYCKDIDSKFSFYTKEDKKFRFLRNSRLTKIEFKNIVIKFISTKGADYKKIAKKIWMNKKQIKSLATDGHQIGLHSHSHPYSMKDFNYEIQLDEYFRNFQILNNISGIECSSVAYPLGSFNQDTLKVMKKLKIKLGFRSSSSSINNNKYDINSSLLLPRIDSAFI